MLGQRGLRMDYGEIDWPRGDGEVQVFTDFHRRRSRAARARVELFPGQEKRPLHQHEREAVWARGAELTRDAG
jgi:hypothetical protein